MVMALIFDLSCEFSFLTLLTSYFSKASCCCSSVLLLDAGRAAVSEDMTGEVTTEQEDADDDLDKTGCEVGRFAITHVGVISDFTANVGLG